MSPLRISLVSLALGFIPFGIASGQTITAYKTGEQVTGMTKQCYYNGLGNQYTQTIQAIQLCPLSIKVQQRPSRPTPQTPQTPQPAVITAYKTGERVTGMTKQCFYNGLGNEYVKTIQAVQICPLTVKVKRQ